MQYDVKSAHAAASGVMIPFRTRLKGIVWMPYTQVTEHSTIVNNSSIAATYARAATVCTITTPQPHGLFVGAGVELDFAAGGPTDDFYLVKTVPNNTSFTVTVADSGDTSGAVTVWDDVLFHMDSVTELSVPIYIPNEGILAKDGIRVFLGANMHVSVFYG